MKGLRKSNKALEQIVHSQIRNTAIPINTNTKELEILDFNSDISITLNIYTQVMEDKKIEAVEKLNTIFAL